jgi:RimJ/RimL family protein N-acetyltransferase
VSTLRPWGPDDLGLLRRLLGDAAMMEHLGGPETEAKIRERQLRYQRPDSRQYAIVLDGFAVGWVGYWERQWLGADVYETGWSVIPEAQGCGLARRATSELLEIAGGECERRFVHAFPSVDNGPSNRICERVGFTLLDAIDFEYPKGSWMRCNDWRFDLQAANR